MVFRVKIFKWETSWFRTTTQKKSLFLNYSFVLSDCRLRVKRKKKNLLPRFGKSKQIKVLAKKKTEKRRNKYRGYNDV